MFKKSDIVYPFAAFVNSCFLSSDTSTSSTVNCAEPLAKPPPSSTEPEATFLDFALTISSVFVYVAAKCKFPSGIITLQRTKC